MSGLVDLHGHFLPGLDDGARDLDATLSMLRLAWESGTRTLVATPHMFCPRFALQDPARIENAFAACMERLAVCAREERYAFLSQLTLVPGAENYLSHELMQALEQDRVLGLNRSRYILIEFPPYLPAEIIETALRRFLDAGKIPVVAHIERYPHWSSRRERVRQMIERGCLLQVNAGSLIGRHAETARRTLALLGSGTAHVVASDAHDSEHRGPDLRGAFELIAKKLSATTARACLVETPTAIVYGRQVAVAAPKPVSSPPWWRADLALRSLFSG